MKLRQGWVSNSSSTSFVVLGWEIESPNEDQLISLAELQENFEDDWVNGTDAYGEYVYGVGIWFGGGDEFSLDEWIEMTKNPMMEQFESTLGKLKMFNLECE